MDDCRGDSGIARGQPIPRCHRFNANAWGRRFVAVGVAKGSRGGRFVNRPYKFLFRYFTDIALAERVTRRAIRGHIRGKAENLADRTRQVDFFS